MRHKEEMELTRTNVTPAQFAAYVRQQFRKHNFVGFCAEDIDLEYWKKGNDMNFYYHDVPGKPCKAEKSASKPYMMQTYVLNWDGTVYNFIMEFDFDDEKKGHGYCYFINTWDDPEEVKEEAEEVKEEKPEEVKAHMVTFKEIKAYMVTFKYAENVYCSNIALAADAEMVKDHYSQYEWVDVRDCQPWELEEARRKGKPIIKVA